MPPPTARNLLRAAYRLAVEERGRTPIFDADTDSHIAQLASLLSSGRSTLGILLCGQCGNGKTTLVRALQRAIALRYADGDGRNTITLDIADAKYLVHAAKHDEQAYRRLCQRELLAIDDLGIEPAEVLDYGNTINPAIDLLCERYNQQLFTVITTNLTPHQLREHYGDRIADRFNEMFSRIIFSNPSYRTPNPSP